MALLESIARIVRPEDPHLAVLHVNHGTREGASAGDEEEVARRATRLSLPFHALHVDPTRTLRNGRPSEGRLRSERYRLFRTLAAKEGLDAIYLAHHLDDQIEGVVLASLRQSGLKGLSVMRHRRLLEPDGPILVRPFLKLTRAELRAYLREKRLSFRHDSSNDDLSFLRNVIRHVVLPRLREDATRDLDADLLRLARLARYLWRRGGSESDRTHRHLEEVAGVALSQRSSLALQKALKLDHRGVFTVTRDIRLEVLPDGQVHRLDRRSRAHPSTLKLTERTTRPGLLAQLFLQTEPDTLRRRLESRGRAFLDGARIQYPTTLRHRRDGDRFQPIGHSHPLKLKTLLIKRKVPRETRDRLLVLEDREGIVWVEGLPPAARVAITSETDRVVRLRSIPSR